MAFAACPDVGNSAGYVRAAASGAATGADWTNAFTDLPASLVRGCTYYVAGGSYGSHTFADADSGTTLITVQAATVASHGTATGWNNAFQAQATFTAPINFTGGSDYYTFNGAYRANTGSPWLDWRNGSSYGFAINNNNGSNCPITTSGSPAIHVGTHNGASVSSNVTLEFLNVIGASDFPESCGSNNDQGVDFNGVDSTTLNAYLGFSYIHDQAADQVLFDAVNGGTMEFNYIERSSNGSTTNHLENLALRTGPTTIDNNIIVRYNFIGACGDTSCIGTPSSSNTSTNWYIYGNVVFINLSEAPSNCGPVLACYSSGDGAVSIFSMTGITGLYFAFNTISSLSATVNGGGPCGWFPWSPLTTSNVFIENNVWYNCPQNNGPATNTGVTWDYQEYFTAPSMATNDTAAHTVNGGNTTNPFVNVANSANANNYNLTGHTTAGTTILGGTNINALPPGCTAGVNCMNVDMNGTTRANPDRGAMEFISSPPPSTSSGQMLYGGQALYGGVAR